MQTLVEDTLVPALNSFFFRFFLSVRYQLCFKRIEWISFLIPMPNIHKRAQLVNEIQSRVDLSLGGTASIYDVEGHQQSEKIKLGMVQLFKKMAVNVELQHALGARDIISSCAFNCLANGKSKGFESRFRLVVVILPTQYVDMQCHTRCHRE